ncbi:PAS domain S-box protein, partial [Candidatus Pacearchaeota archaeon]|nr:PAS domain S-box protein [Candidatus Pacearchaeota archaeon]
MNRGGIISENKKDESMLNGGLAEKYLNIAGTMIVAIDSDGKITLLNKKGYEVLGYNKGELIGKNWFYSCLPKENIAELKKVHEQNILGEKKLIENYENPVITKKGEKKIIHWYNTLVTDDQGKVIGTLSSGEDITEKKKSEEELGNIFNLSPEMICICTPEGGFLKVSPSCERILGYKQEEILKLGWAKLVHPEDAGRTTREVEKQLKGSTVANFVNRFRCKDGSYKTLEWQATSVIDGVVYATAREITGKKEAEEAIKKEKDRAEKYLEVAGIIIVAINDKGIVTLINKKGCEVLGYKKEEIEGKDWFNNFLPVRVRKEVKAYSIKLLSGDDKPVERFINPILTKSGKEKIIDWHNIILKDDNGKIIGHLSSGEDITEKKKAEEEIKKSKQKLEWHLEHTPVGAIEYGLD